MKIIRDSRRNDIVYFTDTSDAGVITLILHLFFKFMHIKVVTTTHDLYGVFASRNKISHVRIGQLGRLLQSLIVRGLNYSTMNVAVSDEAKRQANILIPNIRTEVLHNPIHLDHSFAKQVNKELPNNYATLIMEPDWRKDRDSSIQLWKALNEVFNDLYLIIVGSPLTEKESKLTVNIEKYLIVKNHLSESDLKDLYSNSRFNIFLSKYEGFGYPILEANIFSKPSIVYNTLHFKEIAGEDNIYIDMGSKIDVESLVNSLEKVNTDRLKFRVKNLFSIEKFHSRQIYLLEETIKSEIIN
jgi:glycosyltransferase involved in cell wall biosynthesis